MIEKLVRDKIPEIIKSKWEECEYYIANKEQYFSFLLKKVVEESGEILSSNNENELKEEIADLLEVIDAILKEKNIDIYEIKKLQEKKKKLKGWFNKKIILTKF